MDVSLCASSHNAPIHFWQVFFAQKLLECAIGGHRKGLWMKGACRVTTQPYERTKRRVASSFRGLGIWCFRQHSPNVEAIDVIYTASDLTIDGNKMPVSHEMYLKQNERWYQTAREVIREGKVKIMAADAFSGVLPPREGGHVALCSVCWLERSSMLNGRLAEVSVRLKRSLLCSQRAG